MKPDDQAPATSYVGAHQTATFAPLQQVTRSHVTTAEAAHYLCRRPQTMRQWAMTGKIIQPLRVNGRLAWPVTELKRLLGVL